MRTIGSGIRGFALFILIGLVTGCGASKEEMLVGKWQVTSLVVDGVKATPEELGNTYMVFQKDGWVISYAKGDSIWDRYHLEGDTIKGSGSFGGGVAWIDHIEEKRVTFKGRQNNFPVEIKALRISKIPENALE